MEHALPLSLQDTPEYVFAHMMPNEIEDLSKIQGGAYTDPKTGYKSFLPLQTIIQHQAVAPHFNTFKEKYLANTADRSGLEDAFRKSGRFGDTEMVILPRPLADLFDHTLYGGRQPGNPKTGKREYFLGGLLNSMGNFFKPISQAVSPLLSGVSSVAKPILSAVGNVAKPIVNSLAPQIGQLAGAGVQKLGNMAGASNVGNILGNVVGDTVGNTVGGLTSGNPMGPPSTMPSSTTPNYPDRGGATQYNQNSSSPSALDILRQSAGTALQNSLPAMSNLMNQKVASATQGLPSGMNTHLGNIAQNIMQNTGGMTASAMQNNQNLPSYSDYGQTAMNTGFDYGRNNLSSIENPVYRAAAEGVLNTGQNMAQGQDYNQAVNAGFGNISPDTMQSAQSNITDTLSSSLSDLLNHVLGNSQLSQMNPQSLVGDLAETPELALAAL